MIGLARSWVVVVLCLPGFFLSPTAVATEAPDPVAVFSTLEPIRDAALSPDGSKAVVLRAIGDTWQAALIDFDARSSRVLIAAKPDEFLFNWCRFANNERVVCSVRAYITMRSSNPSVYYRDGRMTVSRLMAIDADGSDFLNLVPVRRTRMNEATSWIAPVQDSVVSWMPDDEDHILLQLLRESRQFPAVYRLNIRTNEMTQVIGYRNGVQVWFASDDGVLRNAGGRSAKGRFAGYTVDGSSIEPIDLEKLEGAAQLVMRGYTRDGRYAYVLANPDGSDRRQLLLMDARTGALEQVVASDENFDVSESVLFRPEDQTLLGILQLGERRTWRWFDRVFATDFVSMQATLPGEPHTVSVVSIDRSARRAILYAYGNGTNPTWYLWTRGDTQSIAALAQDWPGARSEWLVDAEPVQYRARDGLQIPAYLTLPPDRPAKNLPTIIHPHGGPYARDDEAPNYWTQYLVARGYEVLRPNYRGSIGYGDAYLSAGYEQWGQKMQDDLDDGLKWLIEAGITDPDRVCIVGGSYGGYAALVAAYRDPALYQCAVAFAPVTDLDLVVSRWSTFFQGPVLTSWIQTGAARDAASPLSQAHRIAIPTLVVHGDRDRSAMIEHSRKLSEAMAQRRGGGFFRYIEQPGGDHFLSWQGQRREFFEAMDAHLQRYLQ